MLLKIKDLQKGYMEGLVERKVLDGCALEVAEGEFVVVTGESGSGKSTLLNLISGIDKADGGQIWFGGELVSKMKDQKLSELRRDKIGIVFQFFNLLPGLSAQENVMLSLLFKGISYKDASERAQFLLNEVGLLGKEGSLPDELSGGEMQRVSIARALSTEPKLILADEPTGNLDIENSLLVLDIFEKMVSLHKSAVILVTHDEKIYKRGGVSRYKLSCGSLY